MFLIDDASNVPSLPAVATPGSAGWFREGNGTSTTGTKVTADWLNMVQAELANILSAAGIVPDTTKSSFNQVASAIEALIALAQGNFTGVRAETANSTFTSADFGYVLELTGGASASAQFILAAPGLGAQHMVQNNSGFSLLLDVDGTTPSFYGYTSSAGFVTPGAATATISLPPHSEAWLIGKQGGLWFVAFNPLAFDAAGAAASALSTAETFASALQGNLKGEHRVTASTTFTSDDYGYLLELTGGASGAATFSVAQPTSPTAGGVHVLLNNSNFNLTIRTDGTTATFYGLTSAAGWIGPGSATPTFVLPAHSTAIMFAKGTGLFAVLYNAAAFDAAGAAAAVLTQIAGQLPLYSKTASLSTTTANSTTYTLTTQAVTFPSFGITGGFRVKARATLLGSSNALMQQNFTLTLTDGTNTENGPAALVYTDAAVAVEIEATFFINNVYAPGTSSTFTLKVSTAGGGGHSGQLAMSSCHLDIQVENA